MTKFGYSGPLVLHRNVPKKNSPTARLSGVIVLKVEDLEQRDLIDSVIVTRRYFNSTDTDPVLMFDCSSNVYFIKSMENGYPKDLVQIGSIRKMDEAMAYFPDLKAAKVFVDETVELPAFVREGQFVKGSDGLPVHPWREWHYEPVFYFETIADSIKAGKGDGEYIGFECLLSGWFQSNGHIDRLIEAYRKV